MSSRKPAVAKSTSSTVKQATFDLLRAFGIRKVFGNPGSTELPFLSDWPDDIDYVLGLQEASVVGMADGYAQATRNAGFVNLHSAAGVGNALGNIYTAHRNQTPLVITAGQQARSILPLQAFLYAERASEFPRPYVKYSVEPARAEDVPAAIARAYYVAMQPPCGPTFVSIPIDDWAHAAAPVEARKVSREIGPEPALERFITLRAHELVHELRIRCAARIEHKLHMLPFRFDEPQQQPRIGPIAREPQLSQFRYQLFVRHHRPPFIPLARAALAAASRTSSSVHPKANNPRRCGAACAAQR